MVRICVMGASGKMGRSNILAGLDTDNVEIAGAVEHAGNPSVGIDIGVLAGRQALGKAVSSNLAEVLYSVDVIIDFTSVESTLATIDTLLDLSNTCAPSKTVGLIIGTTGFNPVQIKKIEKASSKFPIVFAPNMSVGVNLLLKVLEKVTKVIGTEYDMEIVEAHHKHKKDAPSGTAIKMGQVMASALGKDLDNIGVFERHGIIGEREPGSIGIQTVRAGDIVGDHTVMFCGSGERIEITHKAQSRMIFANGAVRAAKWIAAKSNGFYNMNDVLGLDEIFG